MNKIYFQTYVLRSLNLITKWLERNDLEPKMDSVSHQTFYSALQNIQKGFTSLVQLYEIYELNNDEMKSALNNLNSIEFKR